MLAWMLSLLLPFLGMGGEPFTLDAVVSPAVSSPVSEEQEWGEFYTLSYSEHEEAFTALFESYETKWSKNGRLMIRQGNAGPYKFVKKGA